MLPARILIVDDHPVTRNGIRSILETLEDVKIIGEAENGSEALQLIEQAQPDLVILDMDMPGFDSLEVAREMRQKNPTCKLLFLSDKDDAMQVRSAFSFDINGYLLKEEGLDVLSQAVQGIVRGEKGWISQRVVAHLMNQVHGNSLLNQSFTQREAQVLQAIVEGKTNQEIAFSLGVSEKTIEKHVYSILIKLNVASRVEAAVLAVRNGWA